jgi:hypothetical protein
METAQGKLGAIPVDVKFLRRKQAAAYLKEKYGFSSERGLAKAACVGGGRNFIGWARAQLFTRTRP